MNWIKVIYENMLLLLALLFLLMLAPPIAFNAYSLLKPDSVSLKDSRSELTLYKGYAWAESHFKTLKSLSTTYYDYITLRRDDVQSDTINIVNGVRTTSIPVETNLQGEVWFFGGSTLWGTGVKDDQTIPAIFEKLSNMPSSNFGESGYTTQQNLNLLIKNYLMGGKPKIVFFYDGINDIINK